MIKKIFNNVSALSRPVGNIVHVGAGQCSELTSYLSLDPQKIILIEADNKQVLQLEKLTRDQEKIDVLNDAVAAKKEQKIFNVLTNQRDSSLLMPDKILEHYPRLAIEREQAITTENLDSILQDYVFDNDCYHLLVLEVQGLEDLVIQATTVELVQKFSGIVVRACDDQMYKKELQSNIIDLLETIGFHYTHQENELYSSVFYQLYFQRSDEKIELEHNKRQLELANNDRQEQAKLAAERLQQLQIISEEHNVLIKASTDKDNQLEAANKAKDEQAKLAADRQVQIEAANKAKDEQTKLAADRQVQIEAANKAKDEQVKLAVERQVQIEAANKAKDEQVKLAADRQVQIEAANKAKDEQVKLAVERQVQIEAANKAKDEQVKLAADRQAQIEAVNKAKDEQAKLATDRQVQIEAANKAKDEQVKLAVERQVQIEAANKAKDEQVKLAADRQAQIEAVNKAKDEQAKLATDRQVQIEAANKAKDEQAKLSKEHQQKIQQLTQELEEAKQTASLSMRLQVLKEGDLRDLQERYKVAQIKLDTQNELLEKLSDRLGSAAQYFHLISQEEASDKERAIDHVSAQLEPKSADQNDSKEEKPLRLGLAKFFGFK